MSNNSSGKNIGKLVLAALFAIGGIVKLIKSANLGSDDEDTKRGYTCPECGGKMHFADEYVLVCDDCNYSVDADYYETDVEERSTKYDRDEWDDDEDDSENLSVDEAALIWASHGKDEDYMFGYSEEELEDAL